MADKKKVSPGIIFPPGFDDFEYEDVDDNFYEDEDWDDYTDSDDDIETPLEVIGILQRTRVGDQGQIVVDLEIELEDMSATSIEVRATAQP